MVDLQSLLPLPPGLVAVVGDEGRGKTRLLQQLAGVLPAVGRPAELDALWLDLALAQQDALTPPAVWQALQARCPRWDAALAQDLAAELNLQAHAGKSLAMLFTGSRRKVALVGLLSSGATVTCLDQPFAALDAASVRVLLTFLQEAAEQPSRTWVVADYEAHPRLPWQRVVTLD